MVQLKALLSNIEKMSQTYVSVLVMVLAQVLPNFGITLGSDSLTTTVATLATVFAAIWALVRRYKQGGITVAGVRK